VCEQFATIALRIGEEYILGAAVVEIVGQDRHVGKLNQYV
jgi:hypothetical protein